MKKPVLYILVAALLFAVFPFALFGCSEEAVDGDKSVTESVSDESVTEENTSTPEEKPMISIKNDPEYKNIALNKSYTKSPLHPDDASANYPDEGGKSMTDGQMPPADGKYSHAAFMGFNKNTGFYRDNGYAYLTVDLGDVYYVDKFIAHVATEYFISVGINAPEFVRIYLSNDGESWYKAGVTAHADTSEANTVASTLELEGALTARYIQYRFIGSSNWIFVCEVEAYGIKAEAPMDYPEAEDPVNVLFVGNSATYYFNVPDKLALIAESAGMDLEVTYCCIGGAYLYQYADANDAERGQLLRTKLAEKKYDYIVIHDNSNANYEDSKKAMDVLVPLFRENGGELLLYERYSSNTDPAQRPISGKRLHEAYGQLAKDFDISKVAHVADAFLIGYEKYSDLVLHFTDDSHHSDMGAYLIAAVMAKEFFDINLDENSYTAGLDSDTLKALKDVAKLACEEGYDFK